MNRGQIFSRRNALAAALLCFFVLCSSPYLAEAAYDFGLTWGWGVLDGTNAWQICTNTSSCQIGLEGTGNGEFNDARGMAMDSPGNFYVVEAGNDRVQKFNSAGAYITKWGSFGTGNGQFDRPEGVAVDSSGNVYILDTHNNRVQKFDSAGGYILQWGSEGSGNNQFEIPRGIGVDPSGNVYVADEGNDRIQKFTSSGVYVGQLGSSGSGNGQFLGPLAIAFDSSGNAYVLDSGHLRVQKFDPSGAYVTKWGNVGSGNGEFFSMFDITVDSIGNVYVADSGNSRIQKFTSSGAYISQWGSFGTGNGQFYNPTGIALDSSGDFYAVDASQNRIVKFIHRLLPTLSTDAASAITSISATLNATISDADGANVSARGFAYGTTTGYGATTTESGSFTTGSFTADLSSLACNTAYHFNAYAATSAGTSTGADQSFTTGDCPVPVTPQTPEIQSSQVSHSRSGGRVSLTRLSAILVPGAATDAYLSSLAHSGANCAPDDCMPTAGSSSPMFSAPVATSTAFMRSLKLGDTGSDVRLLQVFLNTHHSIISDTGPGSPGRETGSFGPKTRAAVIIFQKDHGIPATGFFGPLTREYVNAHR
ncbi:MAG: tripartite motif-containing protein 71 [Candidatus Parcubacteria bacterium]|nr:tripartite motif-containing protein 71 [Candidatus Parcubacteria bacterium]